MNIRFFSSSSRTEMEEMGCIMFPCDLDFALCFDGELFSTLNVVSDFTGSGDRVETVARRVRCGVWRLRSVTRPGHSTAFTLDKRG